MKMLKQVIYDIQKNKVIDVYVDPQGIPIVQVNPSDISEEEFGGMVKKFPIGSSEEISYDIREIYIDPNKEKLSEVITYIDYEPQYPPSQIYSILNINVEYKKFIIDEDSILLGTIPNIVSILQPSTAEKTIAQRFGLVYKDKYYTEKYESVKELLENDFNLISSNCSTLASATTNKTKENRTYYVTGKVIAKPEPYYGGTSDAYIEGISYDSKGYDIDYYNKTIIPYKVTSEISSKHTLPVQNLFYENNGDGGYTEESFSTKLKTETNYEYVYPGSDPLQKKITTNTYMYGKNYINLNDFIVVAHVGNNNQFKRAFIANRGNGTYSVNHTERTHNNYQREEFDNVTFYKQTTVVKSRWEDCLVADVDDKKILYQCVKGATTQQGLSNIIQLLETINREELIKNSELLDFNTAKKYYTKIGPEMIPLNDILTKGGSLHILNSVASISTSRERFERSTIKMVPLGKTNSHRILHSEKVGEISQDYDSKEFIGGGVPLKTYTVPTYIAKASASSGSNIKSSGQGNDKFSATGYGNAVYYSKDDVQIVANNFALINEQLASMNINFKGIATLEELEDFFDERDFIVDKINYDLGRNITSFTCRTVIFN